MVYITDLVNQDVGIIRRVYATYIIGLSYKRGSKAKENKRKRQVVTREVIYIPLII
jgi:hypothetical protein